MQENHLLQRIAAELAPAEVQLVDIWAEAASTPAGRRELTAPASDFAGAFAVGGIEVLMPYVIELLCRLGVQISQLVVQPTLHQMLAAVKVALAELVDRIKSAPDADKAAAAAPPAPVNQYADLAALLDKVRDGLAAAGLKGSRLDATAYRIVEAILADPEATQRQLAALNAV